MVDAIIGMPKWLEPTGFVSFAPALCGKIGRMWIGGSSKIARTAEGQVCRNRLFGSGSAGLGKFRYRGHQFVHLINDQRRSVRL
jgi:hypothetical protein